MKELRRGSVWLIQFGVSGGHQQAGLRPGLIISDDLVNKERDLFGVVIVIPASTACRGSNLHIIVDPPEGGFQKTSYLRCEQIRAIDPNDTLFDHELGQVTSNTLLKVELALHYILGHARRQNVRWPYNPR